MSGSTSLLDSLSAVPPTAGMTAAQGLPAAAPQQSAPAAPTFTAPAMVPPHAAPDNSGATTNLSDADYFAMVGGKMPPAKPVQRPSADTATLDSLPAVQPTAGMVSSGAGPDNSNTWADLAQRGWIGIRQGLAANDALMNTGLGGPAITTPPPQQAPATTFAQRAAGTIGQFASMLPTAAFGAESLPAAGLNVLRQVIPTIAGGISAQAGEDLAPDSLKPLASVAGGLLGGGGAAAAQMLPGAGIRAAAGTLGRMGIGPKQAFGGVNATGSQAAMAAGQLREALGPQGEQTILNPAGGTYETVPGSMPTTAQVAPTPGMLALEKAHRVATPEPFMARAQEQNAAQLGAIESLQPTGTPAAFGESLVQQLDAAQNQAAGQSQSALGRLQAAVERLGGTQSTEAIGQQMRGAIQAAKEPESAQLKQLYDAVDPDGTWALPATPLQKAGASLLQDMSPTTQADGQEMALLNRAAGATGVIPFRDLSQMRTDANAAMARLSGTPGYAPNVRRLTTLKNAIDQTIADGAAGRVESETAAVQSGQMAPEAAMMARLMAMGNEGARSEAAAANMGAGVSGGEGAGAAGTSRGSGGSAGSYGAAGQGGGRAGRPPGTAGVPPQAQPLEPNFDEEAAARHEAAVTKRREIGERFDQGGVGQILRRGKNYQEFETPSGEVPKQIFTGDATEPEEIRRLVKAIGQDKAAAIATEAFANDLRAKGIIRSDGTMDSARFANWANKRKAALAVIPGVGDKFRTAAAAQEAYDTLLADHKASLADFEKTAAARFIDDDPQVAVRKAFASSNPTEAFESLVKAVHGGPNQMGPITAAEAGLRRAVVNHIIEMARSAAPAGEEGDFIKAATFRKWVRQNSGPLRTLFGGQGMQNLERVAAALRRQAFKSTATAGSDTAQNIAAAKRLGLKEHGMHATPLMILGEMLGRVVEHATGGEGMLGDVAGVAAGAGGYMIHAMRQAGIRTINDLVREAMLHPAVAKELLIRIPDKGKITPLIARRIATALHTVALGEVTRQTEQRK